MANNRASCSKYKTFTAFITRLADKPRTFGTGIPPFFACIKISCTLIVFSLLPCDSVAPWSWHRRDYPLCGDTRQQLAGQHPALTSDPCTNIIFRFLICIPWEGNEKDIMNEDQDCCPPQIWSPLTLRPVVNAISSTKTMNQNCFTTKNRHDVEEPFRRKASHGLADSGLLFQQSNIVHQEDGLQQNDKVKKEHFAKLS